VSWIKTPSHPIGALYAGRPAFFTFYLWREKAGDEGLGEEEILQGEGGKPGGSFI